MSRTTSKWPCQCMFTQQQISVLNGEFTQHDFQSSRVTVLFTLHDYLGWYSVTAVGDRWFHTVWLYKRKNHRQPLSGPHARSRVHETKIVIKNDSMQEDLWFKLSVHWFDGSCLTGDITGLIWYCFIDRLTVVECVSA